LISATQYLQKLSLNQEIFDKLFNDFIEAKRAELESFDPFDVFSSYEESVTKIYSFSSIQSYFLLYKDFLENPESNLLKIFHFFEIKVGEKNHHDLAFQKQNPNFLLPISQRKKYRKNAVLFHLDLFQYEPVDEKYKEEYAETIDTLMEAFLEEASKVFDSDKKELQILIDNSLIKNVKDITQFSAVTFLLVIGVAVFHMVRSQNPDFFLSLRPSSTPFATMSQSIVSQPRKTVPATSSTLTSSTFLGNQANSLSQKASATSATIPNQQAKSASIVAKQSAKQAETYRNLVRRNNARHSEYLNTKQLGTQVDRKSLSAKTVTISRQEAIYRDTSTLIDKVNTFIAKIRFTDRIIVPNLTFGQDSDGNLTGDIFAFDSVGMQDANQDLRKEIPKIIKKEGLNLLYRNFAQEGDHFKSYTQREAYKLTGRVDIAASVIKHPQLHKNISMWGPVTFSRLDADTNLIPELSYENGVTPDRLIDYEMASKVVATQEFAKSLFIYENGELVKWDNNGKTPIGAISGENVLELCGTSSQNALQAEQKALELTKTQIQETMSCDGQNTETELQLIADCRVFRAGHINSCSHFVKLQGSQEDVISSFQQFGDKTSSAIIFMENAKAICRPGGPAAAEISDLLFEVKTHYSIAVTEGMHSVNNLKVSENLVSSYRDPTIPNDLSKSALDHLGKSARVFEQDQNKTSAFFNNRKELNSIISSDPLKKDPLFQTNLKLN